MAKAPSPEKVSKLIDAGKARAENINKLQPDQVNVLINSIHTFLRDFEKVIEATGKLSPNGSSAISAFPQPDVISVCIGILLKHLNHHVDEFALCHNHIDHYKVAAWLGYALIKRTKGTANQVNERCVVMTLASELENGDKRTLDDNLLNLITEMLKNDAHNDNHGIGKNGLYLIFRTAAEVGI